MPGVPLAATRPYPARRGLAPRAYSCTYGASPNGSDAHHTPWRRRGSPRPEAHTLPRATPVRPRTGRDYSTELVVHPTPHASATMLMLLGALLRIRLLPSAPRDWIVRNSTRRLRRTPHTRAAAHAPNMPLTHLAHILYCHSHTEPGLDELRSPQPLYWLQPLIHVPPSPIAAHQQRPSARVHVDTLGRTCVVHPSCWYAVIEDAGGDLYRLAVGPCLQFRHRR